MSKDAEKEFDKIHHLFMIKTQSKVRIEGSCLNIKKVTHEKPQWAKTKSFPLRIGTRQ